MSDNDCGCCKTPFRETPKKQDCARMPNNRLSRFPGYFVHQTRPGGTNGELVALTDNYHLNTSLAILEQRGEKDFGLPASAVSSWLQITSEIAIFGSLQGSRLYDS